jgi:hypothetical protein
MCASSGQTQLGQEQLAAYQTAQQMTAQEYANQQSIYGPMEKQFQSIFALGPNQKGFSTEEENTLDSQAVAGTAQNYSEAARAVGEETAGEGGGTNPLPTGAEEELKGEVATSAAREESQQETQIQEADYQQGYNEWLNAGSGLESIAAGQNPLGYENAATGAGSAAGTTEQQIANEDNSWINAALGAAGTVGAGWASGGFKT